MFWTKGVDDVLQVFHKAIEDLESVRGRCTYRVARAKEDIQELEEVVEENQAEAKRAETVIKKLTALLD